MLWQVCLRQPRLVLLGLRGLLMSRRSFDDPRASAGAGDQPRT